MTPKEAGEYVRARWKEIGGSSNGVFESICIGEKWFSGPVGSPWIAAAEFTRQREEEIRVLRFVIEDVKESEMPQGSIEFILNILKSQLAALLVGMKETE